MKMKAVKRMIAGLLTVGLVATSLVGCGGNEEAKDSEATEETSTEKEEASGEKIHFKILQNGMDEEQKMIAAQKELQAMEKYANVEFEFVGRDPDFETKMPIQIAGGEEIDLIIAANPIVQQKYADEGLIQPLDSVIADLGIDFETEFGSYAANAYNNGEIYTIPHNVTRWVITYNKQLFDDAGVEYPDPLVPMTWDEWEETSAAISSGEGAERKYGSFYLPWSSTYYAEAISDLGGGEAFYTTDGKSNIEDPAFKKTVERVYNMMHVEKCMPTHANALTAKTGPTEFMNGKYGMAIGGGWNLSWAMDFETYPREWKVGVAPVPVNEGETQKSWGIVNGYAVPITAKDPSFSVEVAMDMVKLAAKYSDTTESAIRTVKQDLLFVDAAKVLADDGITLDILKGVFANPDTIFLNEKITGKSPVEYEKIFTEEMQAYLVDERTIDDAITNIKIRADELLAK